MCSSIDVEGLIFIAKKEVAFDDRSGMRSGQIRRIHVKKEMHVARVVSDANIAPGRGVTKCTVSRSHYFLCRVSLLGDDFICDGQERGIHGVGVV